MADTKIEWAEKVWNPVTGCTPISEGCANCYAKRMANRLRGRCGYPEDDPFRVTFHEERLDEPERWRKASRIFVCSMGDLFHENALFLDILDVWKVIDANPQHTFMLLTKRPQVAKEFFDILYRNHIRDPRNTGIHPPKNLWLGVTAENQARADERIPILLQIPAAVRFVSVEPMLGPVDLEPYLYGYCKDCGSTRSTCDHWRASGARACCPDCRHEPTLNWVICGGESGQGARPMHPDWARSLRDRCVSAGVPFLFKQWGEWFPIYGTGILTGDEDGEFNPYTWLNHAGSRAHSGDLSDTLMLKVGKKKASRLLDGQEWDQYPGVKP